MAATGSLLKVTLPAEYQDRQPVKDLVEPLMVETPPSARPGQYVRTLADSCLQLGCSMRSIAFTQYLCYFARVNRKIHNRIAVLRAEAGISRKALAEKVGVNPQTVGFLERGDYNPSLELALNIAAVFNLPVDLLFSFRPFPTVAETLLSQGDR